MKRSIFITAALALLALGLGGATWWLWSRRSPAPPSDINQVGGTILVYQIDADVLGQGDSRDLPRALKARLDPTGSLSIAVTLEDPDRVHIEIPRTGKDHDNHVQQMKELIAQVGHLEFRILANPSDDKDAITWAQHWFEELTSPATPQKEKEARAQELKRRAERGLPPPPLVSGPEQRFPWSTGHAKGDADYHWVELGGPQRQAMQLARSEKRSEIWLLAAGARDKGVPGFVPAFPFERDLTLLYSRACENRNLPEAERKLKEFDYFVLTRAEGPEREVTGRFLERASLGYDHAARTAVHFSLNPEGGRRFHDLTSANRPSGAEEFRRLRHLAIILDDQVLAAPNIQSAIGAQGQITGDFTEAQVNQLVNILRSGALPVRLKPLPVSETTVEPR